MRLPSEIPPCRIILMTQLTPAVSCSRHDSRRMLHLLMQPLPPYPPLRHLPCLNILHDCQERRRARLDTKGSGWPPPRDAAQESLVCLA